jgi:hypothetical protein
MHHAAAVIGMPVSIMVFCRRHLLLVGIKAVALAIHDGKKKAV